MIEQLNWLYYLSLAIVVGLFSHQQKCIYHREKTACFKAFLDNNYVGLIIFIGLVLAYL
jgi:4-hydroxybenzoate polyprenyltransferase